MPSVSESSNAITLDAKVGDLSTPPGTALNPVAIIEGSCPQISAETATLLRNRLRAAAGLLCLAFGSFFIWRLWAGGIQLSFSLSNGRALTKCNEHDFTSVVDSRVTAMSVEQHLVTKTLRPPGD